MGVGCLHCLVEGLGANCDDVGVRAGLKEGRIVGRDWSSGH